MPDTKTLKIRVVADIGGTNARFAYVEANSQELCGIQTFQCQEHANIGSAISKYIDSLHNGVIPGAVEIIVDRYCLAIAGPVEDDWVDLPNNHWCFSRRLLAEELGAQLSVINDFSAQALSVEWLTDSDLIWLGDQRPASGDKGVIAVLGPGTGLGVAAMLPDGSIVPSEGGHISFAPTDEHQLAILRLLWQRYDRVSIERLLSGMGLENLYWANSVLGGTERSNTASEITAGARQGDELCLKTIADFSAILGSVAGDIALAMGAYPGVYISGGSLPKIADIIDMAAIRGCFDNKGRFCERCATIPIAIVTAHNPGLLGCAGFMHRDGQSV